MCVTGVSVLACACHEGNTISNLDDVIGLHPYEKHFLGCLFTWWYWTKEFILAVVWDKDRTWEELWSSGRVSLITEIIAET